MFNKTSFKFSAGFAGLIVLGIIIWFGAAYLSPEARQERQTLQYFEDLEEAYKTDTYGGETPEETLELFITALGNEDIELASKYFLPEKQNGQLDMLEELSSDDVKSWSVDLRASRMEKQSDNTARFEYVRNFEGGTVSLQGREFQAGSGEVKQPIDLAKIPSGVWKIVDM